MKRFIYILVLALAAVSCRSYEDLRVEDFEILSLSPTSLRSADVSLLVRIDNPAARFTLSDIALTVRNNGTQVASFTSDGAKIGHGVSDVTLALKCQLDLTDINALRGFLAAGALTADVSADYKGSMGRKHNFHEDGVPLREALDKLGLRL